MKISKIRVWKTADFGQLDTSCWVVDVYDEKGNYHAKLFSEIEPIVEKEK